MLTDRIESYTKELADKYIALLNEHLSIKIRNRSHIVQASPCIWLLNGTMCVGETHAHQPEIILRRIYQYGVHCIEHVERCLCHT